MGGVRWSDVAVGFEYDGSLRDIYIFSTTTSDWQKTLNSLSELRPAPVYKLDGVVMALPRDVEHIFEVRASMTPLLELLLIDIRLHCHFFDRDTIEFDLPAADVKGADQLEALVGFMTLLGRTTNKRVSLTRENCANRPLLLYLPDSDQVILGAARQS